MNRAEPKIRRRLTQPGFVLVTMMISTLVLMGFLGLAVDAGYMQLVKTRMQTAADAAALGGVQELKMNGSANITTAAQTDAGTNGFTNGQNGVTVTVNHPPLSGNYTTDQTAVEVIISESSPTFFMQALGLSSMTVAARSVARQGAGSGCMFIMDHSMSGAFTASNGINVTSHCGIAVASTSSSGMTFTGGASVTATSISVAGSYTIGNGATVSPAPTSGAGAPSDPFASLTPPSTAGCTYTSFSVGGGQTKTITPGVYCNGMSLANGVHITMSPGVYVMKGGGLNIAGGATVTGTSITIFNTAATGYPYGPISFSNGTTITLSAPTTGSYAGVLLYQDPSLGTVAASTFSGGTNLTLNGALYFPTSALSYSNGSTTAAYTIIVADSISFTGGTVLNNNYTSLPGGSPVKGSGIVSE